MDDEQAALSLAALGHSARLKVFRLLVRAGPDGLTTGDVGRLLTIAPSTLAHHLGALVSADLVTQERRGRTVVNRANFTAMRALLTHVENECCLGVGEVEIDAA